MEHIVQFAIGIDDNAIKKRVEDNAYDDILEKLVKEAKNSLPRSKSFGSAVNWRYLVDDRLDCFLEKNRDDIIDAAAEKLCESFKRTKAYKEKMTEVVETQTISPIKVSIPKEV